MAFLIVFVCIASLVSYLVNTNLKSLTILALIPIFFCSYIFARRFDDQPPSSIVDSFRFTLYFFIALGWLGYFDITSIGAYSIRGKAVAPFSEESHYALVLGMLSAPVFCRGSIRTVGFVGGNFILQALLFPSLTLLVFSIVGLATFLVRLFGNRVWLTLPLLFVIGFFVFGYISKLDYFSSRLNFEMTSNLTTLVWLQGWSLFQDHFLDNFGLGLGIQALGLSSTRLSEYSYQIASMNSGYINNLSDGGFLFAKLGAELGVAGLLIGLGLTKRSIAFMLIYIHNLDKHSIVNSIMLSFSIELLLRGYGYFSPGVLLILAVLFFNAGLTSQKDRTIQRFNTRPTHH